MCIDLILTNDLHTFQSICVIETGLLDFDFQGYLDLTLTIMKKTFKKQRSFKHFSFFRESLIDNLSNQIYVSNDDGFNRFCKLSIDTLNIFAPIKNKFIRTNQMPFITKGLSREIMKRLRLRNSFL